MTCPTSRLAMLCLLVPCLSAPGTARGQAAWPEARTLPAATRSAAPLVYVIPTRVVTLRAGMGVLVRLPGSAATILSAEPAIARVQPVSPTNLFVMGVGAGRTNVIATTEAGEPIGQFDIVVTPPSPMPSSGASAATRPPAPDEGMAREVRRKARRLVSGARAVATQAGGGRTPALVRSGDEPEAPQPHTDRMRSPDGLRRVLSERQIAFPAASSFSAGFILK